MEEQTTSIWTDLSPVCVLRRILREIPMILAMGLIAAMLTLTAAQCLYQPEYTASATVAVNAKNASYASVFSNLTTTSEIANTFTTLFGSDVFKTLSAEEQSEQQMSGRLTASVVPETNLLQLKVTAPEPVAAFRTLRFVLDHYDVISQHIFQNIVLIGRLGYTRASECRGDKFRVFRGLGVNNDNRLIASIFFGYGNRCSACFFNLEKTLLDFDYARVGRSPYKMFEIFRIFSVFANR